MRMRDLRSSMVRMTPEESFVPSAVSISKWSKVSLASAPAGGRPTLPPY